MRSKKIEKMKNISKWAILSPVIYPVIGLGMLIAAKIFFGGDATIVLSLALPSCALLAFQFSRNSISEETWLPFLWMIRGILSIPGSYHYHYWWTAPKVLASDGDIVSKNVTIRRGIQYGPMSLHVMDRISYAHQTDENKKNAVVYIHGGGFIVCRSEHTSHGAVPFVRNSKFQTAYSLDYPYCPEHRFPVPLLSVIQAIVYLHEEMQIENVLLVGESSGGLLCNSSGSSYNESKGHFEPHSQCV